MPKRTTAKQSPEPEPLWYKDAIIYELHVRAFCDSNGDGTGDFRGIIQKLDYLQDLGVTAIWLLPFYPSPLKDDGYDISEYTDVHSAYGTLRDVETLVKEAHRRGLRVITELVLNHTSDQHPWFQRARRAQPGSTWRDYYIWSDTAKKYEEARVIFKDFETSNWTWDSEARAYYFHRFYSHQPDLNYDNPAVRKAILQVVSFWLRLGVDGLRLDAVPYLYKRDGTNCENLAETHAFLRTLRSNVDQEFDGRMLLAEANQWPEDAAEYLGNGDECHMAFHFPVMPRLFMATYMEDRFPIIDILEQTPTIPDSCQWALFLRNHDELTLEMVTDEERDYMYRVYARDPQARINLGIRHRLAPLLGNNRRKIELMNGLLLSLPGTPVLYYGDEIGMGDNIYLGDRDAVRTPMQWSADMNAGFSRANPQRLYLPVVLDSTYRPEALNVEEQLTNPHSLLWWMKRLIILRKRFVAFGRGTVEFLYPDNSKVLAFVRSYDEERILVVANLSRFVQYVELDLSNYLGSTPIELFGSTEFPPIGELPYLLTLGPHAFYWFGLQPAPEDELEAAKASTTLPLLSVEGAWELAFEGRAKTSLEKLLPGYLRTCRWFTGKARPLKSVTIEDAFPLLATESVAHLLLLRVRYATGEPETYVLPVAYAAGDLAADVREREPRAIIARLSQTGMAEEGIMYDALWNKGFCETLLGAITHRRRFKGKTGEIVASPTKALRAIRASAGASFDPSVLKVDQSNTSLLYGDRLILKLIRRIEDGTNPDLEIGRFLTERTSFAHAPSVAGALAYRPSRGEQATLGILQEYVGNQGDAWRYTVDALESYFERVQVHGSDLDDAEIPAKPLVQLADEPLPSLAADLLGPYVEAAYLLGRRTAELHTALASDPDDPDFTPEPFDVWYQRSQYQAMRNLGLQVLGLLRKRTGDLPQEARADAERVLKLEGGIHRRLESILDRKLTSLRIRCHGDYHLGQVLFTGKDFVIIDFEGEPARSLSQRRLKRAAAVDLAGMLRSFHYAASAGQISEGAGQVRRPEDQLFLEPWVRFWYGWVGATFLKAYLETTGDSVFVPRSRQELQVLLDLSILEKALYEVNYELNSRPEWAPVPLKGIVQIMNTEAIGE